MPNVAEMKRGCQKGLGLILAAFLVMTLAGSTFGQRNTNGRFGSKAPKVPQKSNPSAHVDRPMTFRLVSTCNYRACPSFILARGTITEKTPLDFQTFLASQAKNDGLSFNPIYFDSPGGSLYGGILLGRIIREHELSTTVGDDYLVESDMWDPQGLLPKRPVCYSACAYAFMGGKSRTVANVGKLGLHQFRSTADTDESSTQITMALLGRYLDEMGIKRTVLDVAALTLPEKIRIISVKEAEAWNIISKEIEEGEWTLRNLDDGSLYLLLSQREYDNLFVLTLFREDNGYILQVLFSKRQKVRKPHELREIFNDADIQPLLCIDKPNGPCVREVPFKVEEGWRMDEKLVASISLRLSRSALISISNGSTLTFESNFPMVLVDLWPDVTVSTAKLKGLINALDKSQ